MKNLNLLFLFTFALALMLLISVSSCENDEIEIKKYSLSGWDMMNENELMLVLDVDPIDADIINVKIYSDNMTETHNFTNYMTYGKSITLYTNDEFKNINFDDDNISRGFVELIYF